MNEFLAFASCLLSAISVTILVKNEVTRYKNEKMKLIITPQKKVSNNLDNFFYLHLTFSNESALPISILNLRLYESGDYSSTYHPEGFNDGFLTIDAVDVKSTLRMSHQYIKDYKTLSVTTPFVIGPYSAIGGYFAFWEGGDDSFIIGNKDVELFITTSRKAYKIEMDLGSGNFYDISYQDNGDMFGLAVGGKRHQDTSIPDNYR